MKVKVPKENKIGSIRCRVQITPYLKSDQSWRACLNERTNLIEIDSQLKDNVRDRSYVHEVVHQIDINYHCGLSEENIDRIAHGFCEYLFDNLSIELDWVEIENEYNSKDNP